jgi:hypothetical protein
VHGSGSALSPATLRLFPEASVLLSKVVIFVQHEETASLIHAELYYKREGLSILFPENFEIFIRSPLAGG